MFSATKFHHRFCGVDNDRLYDFSPAILSSFEDQVVVKVQKIPLVGSLVVKFLNK